MSDDLGYNDISYNSDHAFMPNIDFLANNGMIFDSFYTQPVCTPSRAQFMTGRYTNRYGLQHRNILPAHPSGIPADEKTFPEYFKECGYSTEMIGKWHLGQFSSSFLPQNRGFVPGFI
ncbi:Oidioi.mRNA.OKI2018_I69.PAR.g11579.t1.cds [Oikopleura dioica]|uniref:Oidioi.mRNA.OKI2018_I69.PAR.g11579.t1.cds n=1 Tax=Oikopleura dioica TaxID=34765 RepID=A0ABN7S3N2_OIKDI|nr:Oidioi.mRNA.OKI2018_I69.PAR.g11579.t1.cds [Oikopleura dioica]